VADNRKFLADISRFTEFTARDMLAVAKQSLQDTLAIAQTPTGAGGPMPVDLGALRNSLTVEIGGAPVAEGEDSYVLGLVNLQLGDPLQFEWAIDYAIPRHYMTTDKPGGMWRDIAAAQWDTIVQSNANKLRAMR
jgi:hypothetical protein